MKKKHNFLIKRQTTKDQTMHVMERDHFVYVRNVDGREKHHKLWSFCALSFLVWSVFMHCKVALLLFFMMCIGLYFWLYSSFLFLSSFCCIPFPCLTFLYNHNNNWVPLSWTKYSKTKRNETKRKRKNRANYIRTERVCSQITARTATTIANDDDYQCMHEPRQLVSMQQYWRLRENVSQHHHEKHMEKKMKSRTLLAFKNSKAERFSLWLRLLPLIRY